MKFFLKSLYATIFSSKFYAEAVAKSGKTAIKVFFGFGLLMGLIGSMFFSGQLLLSMANMDDVALTDFPAIHLDVDGLDITELDMPFEFTDGGQYVGVDTTGQLTEIPEGYAEGFVIGKTGMVFRSKEAYGDQEVQYSDIFTELAVNPIDFDGDDLVGVIRTFGIVLMCLSPFVVVFGIWFVWGTKITVMTLVGSVILSLFKKENAFKNAAKITIYAAIPVFYVTFLWGKISGLLIGVEVLSTIICLIGPMISILKWAIFWTIGYMGVYKVVVRVEPGKVK